MRSEHHTYVKIYRYIIVCSLSPSRHNRVRYQNTHTLGIFHTYFFAIAQNGIRVEKIVWNRCRRIAFGFVHQTVCIWATCKPKKLFGTGSVQQRVMIQMI